MAGIKGTKRGRKARRIRKEDITRWYPDKMLDNQKEEKASAKIETKKERKELAEKKKKELIKMYMERYGVVPKDLQC